MGDPRVTAQWFVDGWALAYHNRAKAYGYRMPADENARMKYALARMYEAMRREDEQRAAIGKERIWFTFGVTAKAG